jgi:hypothetical protein
MTNVSVVGMRVRDGDDASCLNLNRAQVPRLLAVRPEELQRRRAFAADWGLLDQPQADGRAGDRRRRSSDGLSQKRRNCVCRRARKFVPLRSSTSSQTILQGGLIISERNFIKRFPSASGHRVLLVDAAPENSAAVADQLSRALRDRGLEVVPAWRRLVDFQEVENTYIAIFQALGGLGLLLGSFGLGIVVLRNVLERRSELALLRCGFQRSELQRLVPSEHWR